MGVNSDSAEGRSRWRWLFVAGVGICYAATYLLQPDIAVLGAERFLALAIRIAPALGLIFLLLILIDMFIDREWIVRRLGLASGPGGWALALAGGILSMGPMYAWYPLLLDLRAKGMRPALIGGFLYSRAIKLPLLPLMVHYFGFSYTAVLTLLMLAGSVVSGLATARLADGKPVHPPPSPD
jgi:uncharacterized membrane protein YraQ (UPF0718 family)